MYESHGSGLIDKRYLKYIRKWLDFLLKHEPDIPIKANDTHGRFSKREIAPLNLTFELDYRERGEADYKLTVKNYEDWITSLEEVDIFLPVYK